MQGSSDSENNIQVRLSDSWTTCRNAPVYSRHKLTVSFGWGDRWQRRLKQAFAAIASTNAAAAICLPDGGDLTYMLHCITAVREGVARRPCASAGFLWLSTGRDRLGGYPCGRNSAVERALFRGPLARESAPGRLARRSCLNLLRVAGATLGSGVSLLAAFNRRRSIVANNSGPVAGGNPRDDSILAVETLGVPGRGGRAGRALL